jgi:hypothetical protein
VGNTKSNTEPLFRFITGQLEGLRNAIWLKFPGTRLEIDIAHDEVSGHVRGEVKHEFVSMFFDFTKRWTFRIKIRSTDYEHPEDVSELLSVFNRLEQVRALVRNCRPVRVAEVVQ